MVRKFLVITALLTHLGIVHAQTEIYGGVGAGLNQFMPERNVDDTIVLDLPLAFPTTSTKSQDGTTGADLSAFLGVKQHINQAAIAVELSGNLSSAQTETKSYDYNNNNVTAIARIRERGNVSLSVLPGFYMNNKTEAYLRVGFQRGSFDVKSAGDTGGNLIATGSTSRWLSGYALGLGVETCVVPYMSARFEYTYSGYQSVSQSSVLPPEISLNTDQIHSKVTPHDHLVMLSFVFHGPIENIFHYSA